MPKRILLSILLASVLLGSAFIVKSTMSSSTRTQDGPSPYYYAGNAGVLLGAGALWASNGGGRAAYVDFYDNMLVHPNPSLAGGNATYYLPLKNEVLSILESENFIVDTFADIPGNLSQYNLIFFEAFFACSPAYLPAIRSYLASGGGVAIWQGAIAYLTYYSNNTNTGQDLSSVADWFGGSYYTNTGGYANVTVANPLGTSLNVGDSLVTGVGYSNGGIVNMSADSQVLATWADGSTFAFSHTYGQGRVYWQATEDSANETTQPPVQNPPPQTPQPYYNSSTAYTLLGAGAKWAANSSGRVAYVSFYDNLMAHPNQNWGADANYYLPMKNDVISVLVGENFTVDTFADIPANLSQYSLLYLEGYFACEPADVPAIQSYVSNGGGLFVWQGAIAYLAAYSKTGNVGQDLSGVEPWFGASYFVNTGGSAYVSVSNPLGTPLNKGDQLVTGVGMSCVGISGMSNGSQVLATWEDGSTFAFTHAYGQGRVYWQANQNSGNSTTQPPVQNPPPGSYYPSSTADMLLGAGALWASNGGGRAAYVDFYDNMLAHPNPSLAGGNATYYLPLKNEVVSVLEGENFTVDTFADIPGNLSQYNLLYLEAFFACSPAIEPVIRNYIAGGGGVVLWQGAIAYIAYESKNTNTGQDLSGVGDWFGGSYYVNSGGDANVTVANPLGTSLNVGDSLVTGVGYSNGGIVNMSADSQVLATWADGSTFAFSHTYGQGRVYWQATEDSENSAIEDPPNSVTGLATRSSYVYQGNVACINVTVSNIGYSDQNVLVTLYYNMAQGKNINSYSVNLGPGETCTLPFVWNTANVPCVGYTLIAVAAVPAGSTMLSNSNMRVKLMGDVDGNGLVNMKDITSAARSFGSTPTRPNWNPAADFNGDGLVNMKDIGQAARNFGRHYP